MSMSDSLSAAFSKILNAEKSVKREVEIKNYSKLLKEILDIYKDLGYIGSYNEVEKETGQVLVINLLGNINKCGSVRPRFPVKSNDIVKFEKRYLPSRNVGKLIISTPKGLMTHNQAKDEKTGGILLSYVY